MKPQQPPCPGLWGMGDESEVGGWNNVLPFTPMPCQEGSGRGWLQGWGKLAPVSLQSPERPGQRKRAHFLRTSPLHPVPAAPASVGTQTIMDEETGLERRHHLPLPRSQRTAGSPTGAS